MIWGGYGERGWWTLAPGLWHGLSPHSVCKKSPNLLAALLSLLDLSLKQCQRWVHPCAGKGRFPWAIRPKKECIKSCETCFANTLYLNDKDPSMKWVCFPKVLWSFSYLTLTQNKPWVLWMLSIWLLLPDNDWRAFHISPVFLCKLSQQKPVKARVWTLSSWESGCAIPFPSQDAVVHVNLSQLSHDARDTACQWPCH